jgi:resuscitation-promoting factor RpfB
MPGPSIQPRLYLKPFANQQVGERFRYPFLSLIGVCLALLLLLSGCAAPAVSATTTIHITIQADGTSHAVDLPSGSSVTAALSAASLVPGALDRIEPSLTTVLKANAEVRLVRVQETYDVRQETIPYEHQSVRNESLPDGDTRLIQSGVNGLKEITYRRLVEDGKEISVTPVKETDVTDPIPEIVMVGVQLPFSPLAIPGRLAYLTAGNGWVMQTTTGIRYPVITTGDLDGHIFRLSPDGQWLLFSRKGSKSDPKAINSLWIVKTDQGAVQPVDIKVANVVLFADWDPLNAMTVVYSTVEPRSTPPGWQANNDLQTITFTAGGVIANRKTIVGPGSGGIYGWWGTLYAWSPDGKHLAYARPDQIGLVDLSTGKLLPKMTVTPYQSHSDWAWVPGLGWNPDGSILFTVDHGPSPAGSAPEDSSAFHLSAYLLNTGLTLPMTTLTGMFAYPQPSPAAADGKYQVAYLQAIFPDHSDTSRYRLEIMDQDGSNHQVLFPTQGSAGLSAQDIVWSPKALDTGQYGLALMNEGNLWLVETGGAAHQVTGDGLVSRVDWR